MILFFECYSAHFNPVFEFHSGQFPLNLFSQYFAPFSNIILIWYLTYPYSHCNWPFFLQLQWNEFWFDQICSLWPLQLKQSPPISLFTLYPITSKLIITNFIQFCYLLSKPTFSILKINPYPQYTCPHSCPSCPPLQQPLWTTFTRFIFRCSTGHSIPHQLPNNSTSTSPHPSSSPLHPCRDTVIKCCTKNPPFHGV